MKKNISNLLFILILIATSCSGEIKEMIVVYTKGEVIFSDKSIKAGYPVKTVETVRVGKDSMAVVNFGSGSGAVIGQDSELKIEKNIIHLLKGSVCIILKNRREMIIDTEKLSFIIDRGYLYLGSVSQYVQAMAYHAEVKIKYHQNRPEGSVSNIKHGDLMFNYKNSVDLLKMSQEDLLMFRALEAVNPSSADPVPEWSVETLMKNDIPVADRSRLKRIERIHGRLSIVETRDNRRYIGHVTAMNKKVRIITAGGTVEFDQKNIKSVRKY